MLAEALPDNRLSSSAWVQEPCQGQHGLGREGQPAGTRRNFTSSPKLPRQSNAWRRGVGARRITGWQQKQSPSQMVFWEAFNNLYSLQCTLCWDLGTEYELGAETHRVHSLQLTFCYGSDAP